MNSYTNGYMVFTHYVGRALGGVKDYLDTFDTVEDALDNILAEPDRYYQIVDRETFEVVREGLAIFKDCEPGECPTDDWPLGDEDR